MFSAIVASFVAWIAIPSMASCYNVSMFSILSFQIDLCSLADLVAIFPAVGTPSCTSRWQARMSPLAHAPSMFFLRCAATALRVVAVLDRQSVFLLSYLLVFWPLSFSSDSLKTIGVPSPSEVCSFCHWYLVSSAVELFHCAN